MATRFQPIICAAIALCMASLPTPALATDFTPEGHQHWVEVARGLTAATNAEGSEMMIPCAGFSALGGSAEIRHEYFQVPKWAVSAHAQACYAFNTLSKGGKGFMHTNSGDVCKFIKAAVDNLGKAKAGVDPDDVVTAAQELKAAMISLGSDLKEGKACRFG